MRLTRRDALAALAAAGVGVAGGAAVLAGNERDERVLDEHDVETLVAAARVLYPSAVEGVDGFVAAYADRRAAEQPEHAAGVADAVAYLDDYATAWYDDRFAALDADTRDTALRRMGADTADPDPVGSDAERVRYYVVNDLLFALYTSPTGTELVGLENPPGHPGGLASYQRGPNA